MFFFVFQRRADLRDFVRLSSSLSPSVGDLASPKSLTIALPTITPSAPHPAICSHNYKKKKKLSNNKHKYNLRDIIGSILFVRCRTCFTCSGFDIPKPTATGLSVACIELQRPKILTSFQDNNKTVIYVLLSYLFYILQERLDLPAYRCTCTRHSN